MTRLKTAPEEVSSGSYVAKGGRTTSRCSSKSIPSLKSRVRAKLAQSLSQPLSPVVLAPQPTTEDSTEVDATDDDSQESRATSWFTQTNWSETTSAVLNNTTNTTAHNGDGISLCGTSWPAPCGGAGNLPRGPWAVGDGTSFDALSAMPTDCSVLKRHDHKNSCAEPVNSTGHSSYSLQPIDAAGEVEGAAPYFRGEEDTMDFGKSPALSLGTSFFGISPAPRPYSSLSCSSGFGSPHPLSGFGSPSIAGLIY